MVRVGKNARLVARQCVAALATALLLAAPARAADPDPSDWPAVLDAAEGQTVYFNAWGGSQNINDYIGWVADTVKDRFGVTLQHVKLDDTANAVAAVVALVGVVVEGPPPDALRAGEPAARPRRR